MHPRPQFDRDLRLKRTTDPSHIKRVHYTALWANM